MDLAQQNQIEAEKYGESIEFFLVDYTDIIEVNSKAEDFVQAKLEQLAQAILNTGVLLKPLLLKQIAPERLKLLHGDFEYHASIMAIQMDKNRVLLGMIAAMVIREKCIISRKPIGSEFEAVALAQFDSEKKPFDIREAAAKCGLTYRSGAELELERYREKFGDLGDDDDDDDDYSDNDDDDNEENGSGDSNRDDDWSDYIYFFVPYKSYAIITDDTSQVSEQYLQLQKLSANFFDAVVIPNSVIEDNDRPTLTLTLTAFHNGAFRIITINSVDNREKESINQLFRSGKPCLIKLTKERNKYLMRSLTDDEIAA